MRGAALGSPYTNRQPAHLSRALDSRVWQARMNHPDPISAGCRAFFTAALGNVLAPAPKLAHSKINRIKPAAGTHTAGANSPRSYSHFYIYARAIKAPHV